MADDWFLVGIVLLWCFTIICLALFVCLLQVFVFLAGAVWCVVYCFVVELFWVCCLLVLLLFIVGAGVGVSGLWVELRWFGVGGACAGCLCSCLYGFCLFVIVCEFVAGVGVYCCCGLVGLRLVVVGDCWEGAC